MKLTARERAWMMSDIKNPNGYDSPEPVSGGGRLHGAGWRRKMPDRKVFVAACAILVGIISGCTITCVSLSEITMILLGEPGYSMEFALAKLLLCIAAVALVAWLFQKFGK